MRQKIINEIKEYIKTEQKDMYTYEDMSDEDREETEEIIEALTDEKIEILIKDVDWTEWESDIIICDIFENVLYRISKKEHAFLFEDIIPDNFD